MNFYYRYNKYILPRVLGRSMQNNALAPYRARTVGQATGIALEIGFGSGLNVPFYKNITKLYALELREELITTAKQNDAPRNFPVEYIVSSAENISLEDSTIDSVVVTWSLCSMSDVHTVLQELRRVLRPTGKIFFVEHGKAERQVGHFLQKMLTPCTKALCGGCTLVQDLQVLFTTTGFAVASMNVSSLKKKPLAVMYEGVAVKYEEFLK
jgi:ubiquinone/menaquinone biosynthesis C-methylase UbiE